MTGPLQPWQGSCVHRLGRGEAAELRDRVRSGVDLEDHAGLPRHRVDKVPRPRGPAEKFRPAHLM